MLELTPDQALLVLQYQLGGLKRESRTTAAVLKAVPAERSDYRPDPRARSAIELVRHIAVAENRFIETVTAGHFDVTGNIPANLETPMEIAGWYEARFAGNFDALTRATPAQLLQPVDFRGMFTWPAIHFLTLGLHHTIHHRGQLATYLRPMGATVPVIYGESYDSASLKAGA
jgi:uncharacterized damage-inducible protein DinB